ncbi:acyltransferase [Chitinispirillales bacterium ANBcel5]|uniref:acyltransferase family protein n=1 Tax=Cellulosispirillum alkaliphilum TaxID=3039283 RepID=UPI002A4E9517|nr:acyltransferase [Chitinispirillales bacterium ANBcel5]
MQTISDDKKNFTATGDPKTKTPYFTAIDGLRLLASINIVLFHMEISGGLNDLGGSPGWLFRIIKGPAFHATAFFLLGGFIFTTKFHSKVSTFNNWSFLKKRFKELYPLHLLTTVFMTALYVYRRVGVEELSLQNILSSLFMHLTFLWSLFPFGTLPLNRPSWALSAFFLCYLLFGPMLKWVSALTTKKSVYFYIFVASLPLIGWGMLYWIIETPQNYYFFFHIFGGIRLFEFVLGMLLARLYLLRKEKSSNNTFILKDDLIFLGTLTLIFLNLGLQTKGNPVLTWFSYHFFMTPLYMIALYTVALQRGVISKFLSFKLFRKVGRASFYPYLLHIPLMSLTTLICENVFGYRRFLHSPINVTLFIVILYVGSYFYVDKVKSKRKKVCVKVTNKEEVDPVTVVTPAGLD